ncbi:MAG: rod shape-determining protein MreC [Candidatus Eisenbacteria bacterium]|uniref:Cell shape-determining protein MreC n=1 Tax=Eiseniibacteriota bacterium TaxID=2212470 RepID=A0A9D6L6T0_UNCEI|nr:rod shape-determining protein MreC [Candidatus Eisenbacteria bacterium]MBI3539671.1 rod shape-determining protein MreC [Candidatus Eisenbacteria bacterium]
MAGVLPPAERRSSALVALYVALSLLLLAVGDRIPQASLRAIGATLFAPLDHVVLALDRLAAGWRENQQLHERVTQLELENARLKALASENDALRARLELPGYRNPTLRPAEVLALTGEPYPASATLGAGSRQGVRVGDAVVTSDGLVGRIGEVAAGSARVVLLTDPNASVACEVESTGVLGLLRFVATPRPRLLLTSVPFADTIRVGQRVLTSGLSRRYPRGIPVGRVARIGAPDGSLTQEIELASAARLSRLRFVFIIPGPPGADAAP